MATIAASETGQGGAKPLSLKACIGWGMGTLAVAALFNSVNVLLLRYLVDHVGIGAALAGTLVAGSKLYDAVIDPIVGSASDRTRSKHGRRRPFVLAGGVMLAIAALLLFNVPGGFDGTAAVIYVGIALLFYSTAYAVFSVPYMAMPAEMTTDYHERSRLISFRVYAVGAASLVATFVGPLLIARGGGGQSGHTMMSLFVATLAIVGTVYCFRATRDAPFHYGSEHVRLGIVEKIRQLAGNTPFMLLLVIKMLQLTALAVTQAATPFLFKQVLGFSDTMLGLYFLVFYVSMMLSQQVWMRFGRTMGKRKIYLISTALYALMYLSWYFVVSGEPVYLTFLRAIGLGATAGAVLLFGQSLLPDTMEWDYRRTGLRREGVLSAVYTIVEKLAFAVGAALTGILLGASGYVRATGAAGVTQPQSAVNAIYFLASFAPMILLALSCVALWYYDLSEEKLRGEEA
ncbi:glycoside-pentoside-hexuronide (GPH):cation symporter [Sphingomonas sp. HF-S4]|uniref:Glycoside-pentoside-hexuronide (GPH):cation symporter n=1 Tax=Sphingomonas agrestis TaxID=3080540 RepID=A0ABU3Y420_9SPHN|nr:glycoside-pentoside-hexuronide (GPH):cation symporter [Sphingomonas sp. HF-S4]MDV3456103.1 glycoside-pentoside-hexuronide (GPH):cation symporter [Sphingomonas sp. HF-S4]